MQLQRRRMKEIRIRLFCISIVQCLQPVEQIEWRYLNLRMESETISSEEYHGGECYICRTRLLEGEVLHSPHALLWKSDVEHKMIHPCSSYPLSDLRLALPGWKQLWTAKSVCLTSRQNRSAAEFQSPPDWFTESAKCGLFFVCSFLHQADNWWAGQPDLFRHVKSRIQELSG